MFAQAPRRPNVKVGSSVPVSEPKSFFPKTRRRQKKVTVSLSEALLRVMAQEVPVGGARVDAKVTTKVTGENRSKWSHLDWEKSDDKEVEKVFKT